VLTVNVICPEPVALKSPGSISQVCPSSSNMLSGSGSKRSPSLNEIPSEGVKIVGGANDVKLVTFDDTETVESYDVKVRRTTSSDQLVEVIRKQMASHQHQAGYSQLHGYMTGKVLVYKTSKGGKRSLWDAASAVGGQLLEGIEVSNVGEPAVVEAKIGWGSTDPADVRSSASVRQVLSLEDSEEEGSVRTEAVKVMSARDVKEEVLVDEFNFFREKVAVYRRACLDRGKCAAELVDALNVEKPHLGNAFVQGRELTRKCISLEGALVAAQFGALGHSR
jgi:aminoglycoside N3'-acetyltransferase